MSQVLRTFPEGFIFGAATAAYQCEGESRTHGKGKIAWDDYLAERGLFSADPASDFYNRYPEDLALCREHGIEAIRVSIAWSRIFPTGTGEVNPEGVAFYHDLFAECKRQEVVPFVGLHHFDTPDVLYREGDFLSTRTIDAFERYARFCFEEFSEVTHWITFNEIWANVSNHYIEGTWPQSERYRLDCAFQAMHNMMVAHARALAAFEELGHPGEIGIAHAVEAKYPNDPASGPDIQAALTEDILTNAFLFDATFEGAYSDESLAVARRLSELAGGTLTVTDEELALLGEAAAHLDFVGLNYYQSRFIRSYEGPNDLYHNSTGERGTSRYCLAGVGERVERPELPRTDWDWLIFPQGLYDLIMRISHRSRQCRIYVTENGMGDKDVIVDGAVHDAARIDYIRQHLDAVLRAIEEGAGVFGYFVWSLMDMFSWTNGYNKRYGLIHVDFDTQKRTPKDSCAWYARVCSTRALVD